MRARLWPLLLAPALLSSQASLPCSAWCLSQRAREALAAGRYRDYLNYARQIAARASDHPGVIYAVARGYALVGKPVAALRWLRRLGDVGARLGCFRLFGARGLRRGWRWGRPRVCPGGGA